MLRSVLLRGLLGLFLLSSQWSVGQFTTPTINATIDTNEYGTHTNGQNQQSTGSGATWFMTWDNTNLYIGITGANVGEAAIIYLDSNPIVPINGGNNSNGTLVGRDYDGTNFAQLQFRADLVVYFKHDYREYRTADGSNGWSNPTSSFGSFSHNNQFNSSGIREIAIPWAAIGGRPESFNWFGYITYGGGNAYGSIPTENPRSDAGGSIGNSARWVRYYTVNTTSNNTSTKPFSRNSYVFNSTTDINDFGSISVWDFTMNTVSRQIARLNSGGDWTISGSLVVGNGTVFFGSGGSDYGQSTVANLDLRGGILNMDQTNKSLNINGNISISSGASFILSQTIGGDLSIGGNWVNQGTFNANNRAVFFNGTSPQTIQNDQPAGISIPFLYIQNNVTAISNMTVSNLLNVSGSGIFTNADNKTLTFGSTSTITNNGTIVIQGSLTDNRASKSFGGTVRYEASSGSQTIEGATYNNLELANNSSKTFNADVSISGNFIVSGGSVTTPSNVSFNGSSAQSIAGLAYNNIDFSGAGAKTFTSNASVNPTATITFGSGNSSVDFDGSSNNLTFTLMSDLNGTARIANANNWTLTGNVTTERYLPAKRAWRLLASPVKGTTNHSVFANWQNNGTDNGRGLLLWHPSPVGTATPTSSNSGLFVGAQPNIYNYVNGAWTAVTNTNTTYVSTASHNNAFMVFVTGPHASSNFTSTSAVTTSSASGQLITGNVNHNIVANQFTLLGNPYASPINPVSLVSNNSGSKLWMLDPSVGLGAYITYDGNWVPEAPSGNDAYIQSGQGFFVRSTQTNFNIAETDKIAGNSNTWFAKQSVQNTNENKIRVLLDKQINNEWQLADGILSVSGNNYSNEVDAQDALKVTNFNENIQFRNGTNNLAIEYQNLPTATTEQPIRLTGTTATSYRLRVRTEGFVSSDVQPILQDTQSGTNHLITTDGTTIEIPFTGVVSTTSNPDNRFKIVYQQVLGVEQPNYNTLQVYPNPVTQGQFVIALPNSSEVATYEITNYLGQIVQKGNLTAGNTNVSIASQAVGVYLVRVQQNGEVYTTKIVKK